MYGVELPEVRTISPDPVLYVKIHNRGITSPKNFSVSTKLAFYLLRQFFFQQSGSVSYGLPDVILMCLYIGSVALIWRKSYEQRSREGTI